MIYDLVVVGGGAAGFFCAINFSEKHKNSNVLILEGSNKVLSKVKISGGGRCNVTHACFEPKELIHYYPRGHKELLGPFHKFQPGDTFEWFEKNNIPLKVEDDNRVFPTSDSSQTIIDCFLNKAKKLNIEVIKQKKISDIEKENNYFKLISDTKDTFISNNILIATGSNNKIWNVLNNLNIKTVDPVPSLFSFKLENNPFQELPGLSVFCEINFKKNSYLGDLLFTHQGITGPGVLKMSAYKAIDFYNLNYKFNCSINWLPQINKEDFIGFWNENLLTSNKNKSLKNFRILHLPNRLSLALLKHINIDINKQVKSVNQEELNKIINIFFNCPLKINGKSTNKAEFVTAGGVDLKEIDFRTMEHRNIDNLYFAGEVLNIDGITGGFNFQAAWTTSWIASQNINL